MKKSWKVLVKVWLLVFRQRIGGWKKWEGHLYESGFIIPVLIIVIASCNKTPSPRHIMGSTMGTYYMVNYHADINVKKIKPGIEEILSDIEAQLSNWDKESWISRFNREQTTGFVSIPEHAFRVVEYMLQLANQTNYALDPTMGKLIELWGFGPSGTVQPPDNDAIQEALKSTGPLNLAFEDSPPRISKKKTGLQLNVSAVAKGYAVDLLARQLEAEGITDYLVNIGGEMRAGGHPENDSPWIVAIQRPGRDTRSGQAHVTIELNNTGLATSGDYRRFLEIDGNRYSHILDPETGRPVQTNLASVSIIAPTTAQADGIATACLVMGLEKAKELVSRMSGTEGLFIQRVKENRFRTFTTSGWPESKLKS